MKNEPCSPSSRPKACAEQSAAHHNNLFSVAPTFCLRFGLRLATDGIVMESGRVLLTGKAADVLDNPEMAALYFGGSVQETKRGGALPSPTPVQAPAPARG